MLIMKNALKSKKVYIIGAILAFLGLIPFFVALIMYYTTSPLVCFDGYTYVTWALLAIYILVGFVWGDLHVASYRQKNKKWDEPLPPEMKISAWKRRLPFFFAASILILLAISLEICFAVLGYYPFIA